MHSLQEFLVWVGGDWLTVALVFHCQSMLEVKLWEIIQIWPGHKSDDDGVGLSFCSSLCARGGG